MASRNVRFCPIYNAWISCGFVASTSLRSVSPAILLLVNLFLSKKSELMCWEPEVESQDASLPVARTLIMNWLISTIFVGMSSLN